MKQLTFPRIHALLAQHGLWRGVAEHSDAVPTLPDNFPPGLDSEVCTNLACDSRKAGPGTLFVCKGRGFRAEYLADAVSRGVRICVAAENDKPAGTGGALYPIIVTDVRKALAVLAAEFYGYPQERLFTIAVTGTKGKTTAAYFLWHILTAAGKKTALFSTIDTTTDGKTFRKSSLTTPESLDLFAYMDKAADAGCTHLVLEVSSQAYKIDRVYGITFDVGVFLNISPDHIGPIEHATFGEYFACKRRLLHNARAIVLNAQSSHFDLLHREALAQNVPVRLFRADDAAGYDVSLPGDFNRSNAAAAINAAVLTGIGEQAIRAGLAAARVPGRMEVLTRATGGTVYVDYAHNYASLHSVLGYVRHKHKGTVAVVTGSTGNKGESRRQGIAQALDELADEAVLTTDDPGDEDPAAIAGEIAAGMTGRARVRIELDRPQAIRRAFALTPGAEDAVLIAGKGADLFQKTHGVEVPYMGDVAAAQLAAAGERRDGTLRTEVG
ncbi:MAG: UDP-N-acetylmuramoyl-L-alanyl-D-glutamate--L-lysine ligase [Spirochaetaceae bacterium]|jgi:UDP-N-acetylmuramoyl-L-alanyl-D-glutamate-L-lysine ligase|nr:UDP-N-acetylmuramoyl-L-alanyl-D-glutamate--L-lysine ligase [Spirochaetaceae bacterium]